MNEKLQSLTTLITEREAAMPQEKTCTTCGVARPMEAFCINKTCPGGRSSKCKPCSREYAALWYKKVKAAKERRQKYVERRKQVISSQTTGKPAVSNTVADQFKEFLQCKLSKALKGKNVTPEFLHKLCELLSTAEGGK